MSTNHENNNVELNPLTKKATKNNANANKKQIQPSPNHGNKDHVKNAADTQFIVVAVVFQIIILILYAISADYYDATIKVDPHDEEFGTEPFKFYSMFQDVHAMMFIGFGFLMTFLRRYGFGALTFNFILCAFGIQWFVCNFVSLSSI